jgi:hypothetical protein
MYGRSGPVDGTPPALGLVVIVPAVGTQPVYIGANTSFLTTL